MHPAPIGTRIRVIANSNSHDYSIGLAYLVHEIDNDGTFSARDASGQIGDYMKWSDCEPAGIGWDWLRSQLDPRSLDLLGAFDGVEHLSLRPDVAADILRSIPKLDDAILAILPEMEENARLAIASATVEQDEDFQAAELDTHFPNV
jgi:hypothetical protein